MDTERARPSGVLNWPLEKQDGSQNHLGLHGKASRDANPLFQASGNIMRHLVSRVAHLHQFKVVQNPVMFSRFVLPLRNTWLTASATFS